MPQISLRHADKEVKLLQKVTSLNCCFVLGLKGVALYGEAPEFPKVALLLPWADQSLWDQVMERQRMGWRVHEKEVRALLFQVLLGVYELHFHGIWHRDLSPNQFLLAHAPIRAIYAYEHRQLLLADLGASKVVQELQTQQGMSVTFTHGFAAPEYLGAQPGGGGGQGGEQTVCVALLCSVNTCVTVL
jgi:serine/threonine protein kinase